MIGPLPHPVEVSRYTKSEELCITHAYTTAQMEAERLRCYERGVAQERARWQKRCADFQPRARRSEYDLGAGEMLDALTDDALNDKSSFVG